MEIRTDLALEAREKFEEDNVEIKGVVLTEEYVEESEIQITKIVIETENGARAMGRPKGTYITIECPNMTEDEEESQRPYGCDCRREGQQETPTLLINID